jgi:predicted dithiol-disulfide oxidoreductase (DUF899 family)
LPWLPQKANHSARLCSFTPLGNPDSAPTETALAQEITRAVTSTLNYGEESVSVGIEEVQARDWAYHFMFAPDWEEGCKSCSFWADNFNGIAIHLNHRDVTFAAVSRAPLAKINAYRRRMGWSFPWVSSYGSDFNFDYHASFTPAQIVERKAYYNYEIRPIDVSDEVGISVFSKNERGEVFHTYSCYGRGIDMLNGAYQYLDLVPKGRDKDGLDFPMKLVRRHDQY